MKRKLNSNTSLPQGKRKILNNCLTLHLKQLEKEETIPKVSRKEEIIEIRAETNEIDAKKKKAIEKINETKSCFFEKVNIDKPLARHINKKKRINKMRS